jgi:6-pyruvoyltetrahydropterin/6-carboxytetrahydropterin synthase
MTYAITKEFSFSAAHKLEGLPDDHPCSRLHGHNYSIKIELMAEEVDEVGFVLDYRELDHIKNNIDDTFDHRCLNDVLPLNPTAENLAKWVWQAIRNGKIGDAMDERHDNWGLMVYVSETPKTWASYDGVEG